MFQLFHIVEISSRMEPKKVARDQQIAVRQIIAVQGEMEAYLDRQPTQDTVNALEVQLQCLAE